MISGATPKATTARIHCCWSNSEQLECCVSSIRGSAFHLGLPQKVQPNTFHLSISPCFALYCLTSSSSTCFNPSELVLRAGSTSSIVRSTSTPLMSRKHLRSCGSGCNVSVTSLHKMSSAAQSKAEQLTCAPRSPAQSLLPSAPDSEVCSCNSCTVFADLLVSVS